MEIKARSIFSWKFSCNFTWTTNILHFQKSLLSHQNPHAQKCEYKRQSCSCCSLLRLFTIFCLLPLLKAQTFIRPCDCVPFVPSFEEDDRLWQHLTWILYVVHRAYFYTVKTDQQMHTLFTITYLYQYNPYMFRWSSHHHQGGSKGHRLRSVI
jgi:hypothetical protein